MRNLLRTAVVSIALLACGSLAHAQRWWGAWPPQRVSGLVQHVHEDLNNGYHSGWRFNEGDRHRLNEAERRLHEFAERWHDRGQFDRGELDRAIGDIHRVVEDNHMSGPERDALWRDLDMLRDMRAAYERHEIGRW